MTAKRAEAEHLFARVLAGESINDYETARLRKDGTLAAVSIAAAPVQDGSGRAVGHLVAYTDITERNAREAEVHRLNAELHDRLDELAASRARIVTAGDGADDPRRRRRRARPRARRAARAGPRPPSGRAHRSRPARGGRDARRASAGPGRDRGRPDGRLAEAVEAAAYYLIAEALTNVAKYAEASIVRVRVAALGGSLAVVRPAGAGTSLRAEIPTT